MDKEMLDIVNDLSKKPTTELALQIMELSSENLILEKQCKKQKEVINRAINFLEKWGEEPDADMYIQMKEYKEFNELLKILNEVKK